MAISTAKEVTPIRQPRVPSTVPACLRFTDLLHKQDGSMAIETAFVLPIFFVLLLGIFQFSMFLATYCSVNYAANVGARYASVSSLTSLSPASSTQIDNVVRANLYLPGGSGSPAILVTYTNPLGGTPGNYVGAEVGVSITLATYPMSIPFWGSKTYSLQGHAYRFVVR